MRFRLNLFRGDPVLTPHADCLEFAFYNTAVWQIATGTPLVILAERLGATVGQVGLLASMVLILTPVQVLSTALLPRLGYKRLMLSGLVLRSSLLVIPIILALAAGALGSRLWMPAALVAAIFLFCLFRAISLAAWMPWFYTLLPVAVRGRYFARESIMVGVASVGVQLLAVLAFVALPVYPALGLLFALAVVSSVVSCLALGRLPDGPPSPPSPLGALPAALPRLLFASRDFSRFLGLSLLYWAVTAPITGFMAYYLKSQLQYSAGAIMLLEVLRYAGMMAGAKFIGRGIDHAGSRPYQLGALLLYLALGGWWLVMNQTGFSLVGLAAYYLGLGLAATGWAVGSSSYLPKLVTTDEHSLMIALHGAATALVGGIATLIWGWGLRPAAGHPGIDPFRFALLHGVLMVGAAATSWWLSRRPEPGAEPAEPLRLPGSLLRPWHAATYLAGLANWPPPPADKERPAGEPPR